jgi:chromosome segregation ATPase
MTKKIIVAAVVLLVGAWLVKKTQVCSYAAAFFRNGAEHARAQIPRQLELDRIEGEIARMDKDYQKLLRVIAERMVSIKKLNEEITVAEVNRKDMAESLLSLTQAIEAKELPISYKGAKYTTTAKAEATAVRELAELKRLDQKMTSKKKTLEAEQRNLDALKDQLDKLVTQKHEFEVRVATLRANQAELDALVVKSPLKNDQGRVADIKKTLDRIEHEQNVDIQTHVLENQYGTKIDGNNPNARPASPVNLQEIRDYVQGTPSGKDTKVAQAPGK